MVCNECNNASLAEKENKYRLVAPIDDSDRNQNTVLGFPGKSYIRFICLFVSKCLQFYFYSGQTDRQTLSFIYIYRWLFNVKI